MYRDENNFEVRKGLEITGKENMENENDFGVNGSERMNLRLLERESRKMKVTLK